ncbi:hypothetical protein GCM10010145_22570 [Streptomyces ruber]|uniref:Aldehyde oxidase/xanthine dehydrogenase second molybdopterin binding domain-containing protein n=2 Tax=Streptomyces TaxID=1883 RepID=A0A918EQU2_9ACTN|nr:hypothetical protein [Streptomyces ruber]GGQ52611.1 hypothetical protein GCM10010145_22570 [Streptomyces ruber]
MLDPRYGHVVDAGFPSYHVASDADVGSIEAHRLSTGDRYADPVRAKGVGEVRIVGTAAAVANAVHHATGVRVRDLPITSDELLEPLSSP